MAVAAGDLDRDGDADMAITDAYHDAVWILDNIVSPAPRIHKGDLIDPIRASYNQTYFITATNPRSVPITQVVVTDTLPPGLDFVSTDYGGVGEWGNPVVNWNLGTLEPGQVLTIRLVTHTRSSMPGGLVFTNTVALDCAECALTEAFEETTIRHPDTPTPTPTRTVTPGPSPTPTRMPYRWHLPVIWRSP
jgi:hypothetical protein